MVFVWSQFKLPETKEGNSFPFYLPPRTSDFFFFPLCGSSEGAALETHSEACVLCHAGQHLLLLDPGVQGQDRYPARTAVHPIPKDLVTILGL